MEVNYGHHFVYGTGKMFRGGVRIAPENVFVFDATAEPLTLLSECWVEVATFDVPNLVASVSSAATVDVAFKHFFGRTHRHVVVAAANTPRA